MTDHEKRIREALEAGPTEGPFITFNDQVYRATDPDLTAPVASWNTSQFTMEGVSIDALYYAACNPAAIRALLADLDAMRGALLKIARMAEDLKRPCSMDADSPQAIRNGQYMNICYAAHAALKGASHD